MTHIKCVCHCWSVGLTRLLRPLPSAEPGTQPSSLVQAAVCRGLSLTELPAQGGRVGAGEMAGEGDSSSFPALTPSPSSRLQI